MRARALTLIEVVASLVLVATTVTALLAASGRSLEQLHSAREQQTASVLAKELINQWILEAPAEGEATEGHFHGYPGWRWTRQSAPYPWLTETTLEELTLTIHRLDGQGHDRVVAAYTWLERPDER